MHFNDKIDTEDSVLQQIGSGGIDLADFTDSTNPAIDTWIPVYSGSSVVGFLRCCSLFVTQDTATQYDEDKVKCVFCTDSMNI